MKNIDLLLKENAHILNRRVYFQKNKIIIDFRSIDCIDGEVLKLIINSFNYAINKYRDIKIPIMLMFEDAQFKDKLTYICLECVCYYIIKILNIKISISANFVQTITSEGISSSPLLLLNTKFPQKSKYIEKFKNDIFKNHFRAIVKNSEITTPRISILMQEISTFLKFFDFEENYSSDIIETIIELVTNGASHSESDCLLDIDITNQYIHKENGKKYRGLNICVLDFSTKKLYTDLENKLICDDNIINKYTELKKIYIHHKEIFFSTNYNQHDFFSIATFQDKISGRKKEYFVGGTGLTKLIKALQEKSDTDNCYVLTGKNVIYFTKENLCSDPNGWISFNSSNNDFTKYAPKKGVIDRCFVYFPGTAYNLNFIIKVEDDFFE